MKALVHSLIILLLIGCFSCETKIDDLNVLVPATVADDPDLPQIQITVGGSTRGIHLETFGNPSKPKLFILHGSVGDFRAWLPYQILADKYFVVMWDQRGTGLSERISKREITNENMIAGSTRGIQQTVGDVVKKNNDKKYEYPFVWDVNG
jgi:pimeloyl-ACP methyl ester carboxylesterase